MARYKYIDTNPRLLPVDLARQLLPGRFEHTVSHLSEANLRELSEIGADALIADSDMRRRDERFTSQDRHRKEKNPLHDKGAPSKRNLNV